MKIEKQQYDMFRLGADDRCVFSTDSIESQLNNNILVIGGTGSGKTRSILNPVIANIRHSNIIAIATKRGDIDGLAGILQKRGYDVNIIDFVNTGKSKFGYDPLLMCHSDADVRNLAHAIVHSDKDSYSCDHFWDDSAEQIIYLVLRFVHKGFYSEGCRMIDAVRLLKTVCQNNEFDEYLDEDKEEEKEKEEEQIQEIPKDLLSKLLSDNAEDDLLNERMLENILRERRQHREKIEERQRRALSAPNSRRKEQMKKYKRNYPLHYAMRNLAKQMPDDYPIWVSYNKGADMTSASITSTVRVHVEQVFNPDVVSILENAANYDFKKMLDPHTALFLYVSPVNTTMHRFVALCYTLIFKTLFELGEAQPSHQLPYPVHVFGDDFATGAVIPDFEKTISIFREKRIAATMLLQSLTQLDTLYGEKGAAIIVDNCDTVVYLGGGSVSTCEYVARRANKPVNEIFNMPLGAEWIFRRGRTPIFTQRYDFSSDSLYAEMTKSK